MKTIHRASKDAHEAVDKITSATTHAAEAFDEKSERLKKAEKRLIKDYTNYTRDNPVTSLGIGRGCRLFAQPRTERPLASHPFFITRTP